MVWGLKAAAGEQALERVARLYEQLRPHLDERQRRVLLGAEASGLGHGGITAVAAATGAHPATVACGAREAAGGTLEASIGVGALLTVNPAHSCV